MKNIRNGIAVTLVAVGLMSVLPSLAFADEAELAETKAKSEALMKENEMLAARIKELEEKAFSKDSKTEELDEKITLIKARLNTAEK